MEAKSFAPPLLYAMEGNHARKLHRLMTRLYTEDRMTGDEMRDAAHLIRSVLEYADAMGAIP